MKLFNLIIHMDNGTFGETEPEQAQGLAICLRQVEEKVKRGGAGRFLPINDATGNIVGSCEIIGTRPPAFPSPRF